MEKQKNNTNIERNDFLSITDKSIFTISKPKFFEYPYELSQVFQALKRATSYSSQHQKC